LCLGPEIVFCFGHCSPLRDEDLKDCQGPVLADEIRYFSSYNEHIDDAESSSFSDVTSTEEFCISSCTCGVYCSLMGPSGQQEWKCETLQDENCADTGRFFKATGSTPGTCPLED
jgi:hypothetical protein